MMAHCVRSDAYIASRSFVPSSCRSLLAEMAAVLHSRMTSLQPPPAPAPSPPPDVSVRCRQPHAPLKDHAGFGGFCRSQLPVWACLTSWTVSSLLLTRRRRTTGCRKRLMLQEAGRRLDWPHRRVGSADSGSGGSGWGVGRRRKVARQQVPAWALIREHRHLHFMLVRHICSLARSDAFYFFCVPLSNLGRLFLGFRHGRC